MPIRSIRTVEDIACCYRNITEQGIRVLWEITTKCNLNCRHCLVLRSHGPELTTKEAKSIISQMSQLNVQKLMFSGGEPLLREDIFELISYAKKEGIHVDLLTNGTLITENVINQIQKTGLTEISISVDGSNAYTHDFLRGINGAYNNTIRAIQALTKKGFDVDMTTVVCKLNFNEIADIIDLAYIFGIKSLTLAGVIFRGRAHQWRDLLEINKVEYEHIIKIISKKRDQYGSMLPIRTISLIQNSSLSDLSSCEAAKTIMSIDGLGYVHPCPLIPINSGMKLNLRLMPLSEIWMSSIFNDIRKSILLKDKICDQTCKSWFECSKGCRGICLINSGDIYAAGSPYLPGD